MYSHMQWQLGLHGTKVTRRSWSLRREEQSRWSPISRGPLPPETEGAGHDHLEGEEREGTDSGIQGDHSESEVDCD